MTEEDASSNIEWGQKKDISAKERLSRRIDVQKASSAEVKDRNNFKAVAKQIKNLSPNLRKLKNKIKDVYDEDDEDEENEIVFYFNLEAENSSLINALKDEEKNSLRQKQAEENIKLQQTSGKMQAILMADKMSKKLGLKGVDRKIANKNVQDATLNVDTFDKTVAQDVTAKTKISTEKLSTKQTEQMVKGLKKIRQAALAETEKKDLVLNDMETEDLIKLGKSNDDKKTAELILEKSGRKGKPEAKKTNQKDKQRIKESLQKVKVRD